ncbi:MAG TPA: phosphoribosylformylglycinamidine synthase II, partial [Dehalococcoidia bacterium]|nr:phosphoribosylformylglycinamidine synthase II [Dehalococcoidia bacterium]
AIDGDVVVLLGRDSLEAPAAELAGSEYLELIHDTVAGIPEIDMELEIAVQRACRRLIHDRIARSAHDCSDGGLLVALAESCVAGAIGLTLIADLPDRWDAALFGEGQSRIVVSVDRSALDRLDEICRDEGVPWTELGTVGGDTLNAPWLDETPVVQLRDAWANGLERALKPETE